MYHEIYEANGQASNADIPKLQVEILDFATFRTHKPKEFLEKNPNGKIPVLIDDERNVTMWDGSAIAMYLLDNYDKGKVSNIRLITFL